MPVRPAGVPTSSTVTPPRTRSPKTSTTASVTPATRRATSSSASGRLNAASRMPKVTLDGPLTVTQLAGMLGVAPTTVSLIVSDLSRKGVLVRREDDADRRRRIIDISPQSRPAIAQWLSPGAHAWRHALAPLSPAQQRTFVDTLLRYEAAVEQSTVERSP